MAPIPIISSLVHYVSHGTPPKADGTQAFGSQCRAAIVAGIDREGIELCVLNPSGIFFQKVQQDELTHAPGTCHWGTSICSAEPKRIEPAPELSLSPDETRAVLDSMKTNDHCTIAYDSEIQAVRGKIEALAGDSGLVLRVAGPVTSPSITNH